MRNTWQGYLIGNQFLRFKTQFDSKELIAGRSVILIGQNFSNFSFNLVFLVKIPLQRGRKGHGCIQTCCAHNLRIQLIQKDVQAIYAESSLRSLRRAYPRVESILCSFFLQFSVIEIHNQWVRAFSIRISRKHSILLLEIWPNALHTVVIDRDVFSFCHQTRLPIGSV